MTAPTINPDRLARPPRRAVRGSRPRPRAAPRRRRAQPNLERRLLSLLVVLGLGFAAVAARLVDVQGISADRYAVLGQDQRLHSIVLSAPRGSILDRNRSELAVSLPRSTVWADPQLVRDPAAAARALSPLLDLEQDDLRAKLSATGNFVYLARRVDDAIAEKVKALELPGVSLLDEPTRMAPAGDLAASVVGQVGVDDDGLSGLELQYEDILAGKAGEVLVERDPSGRLIAGGERDRKAPVRGRHVVLTLDRDLQFFTEQALGAQIQSSRARSGIAVVMDPRNGEILAMANMVAGAGGSGAGSAPQPATYNKAVIDVYEPGSVNKLVTLSAALEEGTITPSDVMAVPDRLTIADSQFQDSEPHPTRMWTPVDVMAQSSNAGAILIGQDLGRDGVDKYLRAYGLAGDSGIDFPGEASGIVPDVDEWSGTTLATLSIGYGLAVTPLQMLTAYNTIANGGVYVVPRLVRSEIDWRGREKVRPDPDQHRVVSPETAQQVTDMLVEVVRSGTGKLAAVDGYTVAGKTGTSRKVVEGAGYKEGAYVATFAGFFPAESPRLSAIVVLDEPTPYYGGLASGPLFAELSRYAARHFQVPPRGAESTGAAATLNLSSATRP
ncbi:MAG: peptidoglycan D,D-transpeptidase FtsI family protein [Acidimicrobiales bacterium]